MAPTTVALVLDALVTSSYLGAGALSALKREGRRMGALLAWIGVCWWLGGPLIGAPLLYWGALVHAAAAAPRGRLGSAHRTVAVSLGYLAAAGAGRIPVLASAAVLVSLGVLVAVSGPGPRRALSLGVAALLGASAAAHWFTPATADPTLLILLETVLCVFAAAFVVSGETGARPELVDLIVKFGTEDPLDRLGRLGPTEQAAREARTAATRLVGANHSLSESLRGRIAELEASRLRLLTVEDQERARLEGQLQQGPVARLDHVWARLTTAASDRPEARQRLDRSRGLVATAREDLLRIGGGLFPAAVADGSIESAIDAVAAHSPVPVSIDLQTDRLSPDIAATVYYVCAEAVANAVKHSGASRIWVTVLSRAEGLVEVEISDDGIGGADPSKGSGLLGLIDRAEVVGGTCAVTSRPGRATVIVAQIPTATLT